MMSLPRKQLIALIIVCAIIGGIAFAGGVYFANGGGTQVPLVPTPSLSGQSARPGVDPNAISGIVNQAGPAVVKIETTAAGGEGGNSPFNDPFFREFFGGRQPRQQPQVGLGSGFLISNDGYILTNQHVIDGANQIKVTIVGKSQPYIAKVVGSDQELDLAVLKVDAGNNLPYLKLGNSNQTAVGDWVIAIGNPYGLDHTVTVGVISAKGRPITVQDRSYRNLLQTDAAINPGNSGGPLINLKGEVIGINTAVSGQAQGIGFAIPSQTVTSILNDLMTRGKVRRGWLGVGIQDVTPNIADQLGYSGTGGVLVSEVVSGGPAEKAGVKVNDIITQWNGATLNNTDDLLGQIQQAGPGGKATLTIYRQKQSVKVSVTLGEKPSSN